jgi:hypothetical protein
MKISLKYFIEQYPVCPLCSGSFVDGVFGKSIDLNTMESRPLFFTMSCKKGHFFAYIHEGSITSFLMTTSAYDISIINDENYIRIAYGSGEKEIERTMECEDFNKWMISHEQILDKLGKLWSLA